MSKPRRKKLHPDVLRHGKFLYTYSVSPRIITAHCKKKTAETGCHHDWYTKGGDKCVMYIPALTAEVLKERDALRKFKTFVHVTLDKMKVPKDPPGEHREAGCRIGQRLAWVADKLNNKG